MDYLISYEDEMGLQHHGILGQKWGVRRYQNYDGTYTQAGMKRYNVSKEKYDRYNAEYKEAKKNGTATNQMKIRRNNAKQQMNKDYKHLKQDKLGDQGKMLYSKGYRIRDNGKNTAMKIFGEVASTSGTLFGAVKMGYLDEILPSQYRDTTEKVLLGIAGASAAGLGITAVSKIPDYTKDKKMRAYYSHTSNY